MPRKPAASIQIEADEEKQPEQVKEKTIHIAYVQAPNLKTNGIPGTIPALLRDLLLRKAAGWSSPQAIRDAKTRQDRIDIARFQSIANSDLELSDAVFADAEKTKMYIFFYYTAHVSRSPLEGLREWLPTVLGIVPMGQKTRILALVRPNEKEGDPIGINETDLPNLGFQGDDDTHVTLDYNANSGTLMGDKAVYAILKRL